MLGLLGLYRTLPCCIRTASRPISFRMHSTASLGVLRGLGSPHLPGLAMPHTPPHLLLSVRTVILLTRLKLMDNSENARRVKRSGLPYCIKLPKNNKVGKFGDVIKIAHLGKVHNALLISNRQMSKRLPRYDHHYIVMLNDKKEPVGTRILGPVPSALRGKQGQYSKIIAMATRFI